MVPQQPVHTYKQLHQQHCYVMLGYTWRLKLTLPISQNASMELKTVTASGNFIWGLLARGMWGTPGGPGAKPGSDHGVGMRISFNFVNV